MLKIAVIILAIVMAYAGVFSLINIITPGTMMGGVFRTMTGKAFDDIQDPEYLKKLEFGQRVMGVLGLVTALAGLVILFLGFRRGYKWTWWLLLFGGCIAWLWGLIYQIWGLVFVGIIIAVRSSILFQSIAMLVFLAGFLIIFGTVFRKEGKREEAENMQSHQ